MGRVTSRYTICHDISHKVQTDDVTDVGRDVAKVVTLFQIGEMLV